MSTIHDRNGSKYALVESNSWSEDYFSTVIQNFAHVIFPFHHCFEFEVDMSQLGYESEYKYEVESGYEY